MPECALRGTRENGMEKYFFCLRRIGVGFEMRGWKEGWVLNLKLKLGLGFVE